MFIRQLSVFIQNKAGRLAEVTGALAAKGIDICALSIADTTNFGVLRMVVDRPEDAEKALKDAGFTVKLNHVIGVSIEDKPGSFHAIAKLLADNNVDIDYLYASVARSHTGAFLIIRTRDRESVAKLLIENGCTLIGDEE